MTSMPASRKARATTLMPRSWPSRPTLARTMRSGLDCRVVVTRSISAPVIENNQLVGYRDPCLFELGQGPDDMGGPHVTLRIVIESHNQDAGMMPACRED